MNIIQHRKTRKYLAGRDQWVDEIEQAKDFATLTEALQNCKPKDRKCVEVIQQIYRPEPPVEVAVASFILQTLPSFRKDLR